MKREELIITIDGPAGSGKSTIAKMLASRVGGRRLDTGAIYRSVALAAVRRNMESEDGIGRLAGEVKITFRGEQVFLDGEDVSQAIRTLEIGEMASRIAAMPRVRHELLSVQRTLALPGPTVCEGRDMGTVVFPDAPVKFFLTASDEERARRRWLELREKGENVSFEEVLAAQKERDERDASRAVAPLKKAEDAIEVDSTGLSPEQVVDIMMTHINSVLAS